jgi:hypothetical protein
MSGMAQVEVVDYLLWTKRIHGSLELKSALDALPPESTVRLKVAGRTGIWRKMSRNSTTGASTPGLQPLGEAGKHWRELFKAHKDAGGTVVEIELDDSEATTPSQMRERWEEASPEDQEAAWEAFKALRRAGWRSERPYGARDELYEPDS